MVRRKRELKNYEVSHAAFSLEPIHTIDLHRHRNELAARRSVKFSIRRIERERVEKGNTQRKKHTALVPVNEGPNWQYGGEQRVVNYDQFAWDIPGGKVATRRAPPSHGHGKGSRELPPGKTKPDYEDALFWEREQYEKPLGPSQAREQYAHPIGPVYVDTEQYDRPIGPFHEPYAEPIGPTRSRTEHIGQKLKDTKEAVVSARDELYGYERTRSGKIRDSGIGRINFFEGNPFAAMDPMGVGGHPAARSFGRASSPYRNSGRRRRRSEDED